MPFRKLTIVVATLILSVAASLCCVGTATTPEPVSAPVQTARLSASTELEVSPKSEPGKTLRAESSTDPAKLRSEATSNSPTPLPTPVLSEVEGPTVTSSPRLEGGTVVEGGLADVVTLNPVLADDPASLAVIELLFDRLLAVDPQTGSLRPALASSWQVSADGLTLTFTLRDDVLWHDGQPFSAADVEFTFKAIVNPAVGSPRQADFSLVEEFKAVDNTTFVVTLTDADCSILYDLGSVSIVPRHILGHDDTRTFPFNVSPIGTGPFVFGGWVTEDHVTLLRNPRHWAKAPHLDAWTYKVVADEEALLAGLESGQLDVIPLPLDDLASLEATGHFQIHRYPANEYYFIGYNVDHPILGDARVRRALSQAVDRQRLMDRVLGGQGQLLDTGLLPAHWAHPQEQAGYNAFDPLGAEQLLTEAGWVDSDGDGIRDREGEPLSLRLATNGENPTREAIAILAQQYYLAVGVAAEVELIRWGNFLKDIFTHDFDIVVFSWPLVLDPDEWELWHSSESVLDSGFNFVSYYNPRVDELLLQGLKVPKCEETRRATIYAEIATILAEDQPYAFLFAPYNLIAVNERVGGVAPSPFAGLHWNLADWYVTR
jgi:peptide/nickel transport system substrate-binding protein